MALNFSIVSFLIGFIFIRTIFQAKAHTLANHGETCNSTNRCNSKASLSCNNGICECIMLDTMAFNGHKCTVLAGEKCTYTTIGSGDDKMKLTEELPCVINSVCEGGFCNCLPDFYEAANGTCLKRQNFGQTCELNVQCKSNLGLVCGADKTCSCNTTNTVFDIYKETCAKLAGASCKPEETGTKPCHEKSKCWNEVCTCRRSYFANPNGECVKRLGLNSSCVHDGNCKEGLLCNIAKRCDCNTSFSLYDEEKADCIILAGATFTLEYQFEHSVENSRCQSSYYYDPDEMGDLYSYTSKYCWCSEGYYQTSEGFCKPKGVIGTPCASNSNDDVCSYDYNDMKCGSRGVCECNKLWQVYDPAKRRCVGLLNSPCQDTSWCVTNSECRARYSEEKECVCPEKYLPSPNETCLAPHHEKCGLEWTNQCNHHQGLTCISGECECKFGNMQKFDPNKRKCISLVYGPCDENISCVENSHCVKKPGENFGKCDCNKGFIEVDRVCEITIGQPCFYPRNEVGCDRYAELRCIDGTCQCRAWEHYDDKSQICRGLVDSICALSKGDYCTPNASCAEARSDREDRGICKCLAGWTSSVDGQCVHSEEIISVVE